MNREICRFFNSGHCRYGDSCFNLHVHLNNDNRLFPNTYTPSRNWGNLTPNERLVANYSGTYYAQSSNLRADAPEFHSNSRNNTRARRKTNDNTNTRAAPSVNAKNAACNQKGLNKTTFQRKLHEEKKTVNEHGNADTASKSLCRSFEKRGICDFASGSCPYVHGDICEFCGQASIHPQNKKQGSEHRAQCIKQHEDDMSYSFAFAKSQDKQCSICFENILLESTTKKFGLLSSCYHTFCLGCITTWRKQNYSTKLVRACPECRVNSDFVYPSRIWVEDAEEKKKLVDKYKSDCAKKHCKYFRNGQSRCPFGNKCFYLHALPDGTIKDVGPPRPRRRSSSDYDTYLYLLEVLNRRQQYPTSDSEDSFLYVQWPDNLHYESQEDIDDLDSWFDIDEEEYSSDFSLSENYDYDYDYGDLFHE